MNTELELKILLLAIFIDIICLIVLHKVWPTKYEAFVNYLIVGVSGVIFFFIYGWLFVDLFYFNTTDNLGTDSHMNIGVIAVVTCPGLIFATIKSSISRITYQIDSVENHGMSYKDQVLLVKILLRIRKKKEY